VVRNREETAYQRPTVKEEEGEERSKGLDPGELSPKRLKFLLGIFRNKTSVNRKYRIG